MYNKAIIVSAYYKIPSKQSHDFYVPYLKNFFSYLGHRKIIFFCDNEIHEEIKTFNINLNNVIFIIKNFNELSKLNKFPMEFWQKHIELDEEKYHRAELGIIWASKEEFIKEASEYLPDDEWFIWVDAGCIRTELWAEECKNFLRRAKSLSKGVYLQALNIPPLEQIFFKFNRGINYIAGAIILVHKDYIEKLIDTYDEILNVYDKNNIPVIMDQYILASIYTIIKPEWLHLIKYDNQPVPDKWFFFLGYL